MGQLSSVLQQRGVTESRVILGRSASTGFAGGGQINRLGEVSRRGLGRDFERGRFGIGQDFARREAGILGALSGNVSSFLQALLAGGRDMVGDGGSGGSALNLTDEQLAKYIAKHIQPTNGKPKEAVSSSN